MAAVAIEERARNELSMTKPGETFYRLRLTSQNARQRRGANSSINHHPGFNMAATLLDVCAAVPAAGFGRRMQTES